MSDVPKRFHWGLLLVTMFLSGCIGGASDLDDLQQYVTSIKSQKGGQIDPLPEIKPYKTYLYSVGTGRSPFELSEGNGVNAKAGAGAANTGVHPDMYRKKEPLEQYALDTLKMVGVLEKEKSLWGLVQIKDGTIHKVQVGNYVGQNFGKITEIREDKVSLIEMVQNSEGGWVEREAAVAISEEK